MKQNANEISQNSQSGQVSQSSHPPLESRVRAARAIIERKELDALLLTGRPSNRYYAGFSGTTSLVLISSGLARIYVDGRYVLQAGEEAKGYEVVHASRPLERLLDDLAKLRVRRLGVEETQLDLATLRQIEAREPLAGIEVIAAGRALAEPRMRKDAGEIAAIRRAASIADQALARVLPLLKPGVTERQVAARLEYEMCLLGAEGSSFQTIVASGVRSALPHGVASEKALESGDAVVIDFGARYNGYCSDMTRTVFIEYAPQALRELYALVLEAQETCLAGIRAGITGVAGDRLARDVIERQGYGDAFDHSTGHSLGLEIHEAPRLSETCKDEIPAGVLMTVEPGIYIAGLGGIRIEDLVLVTTDGCENLTRSPKELLITG
ncbi:MAG: aminopeptidase P family protein [Bacillota bacterium]|nr:aminopeptidase P family protein [Bacillota bacterium]